MDKAMIIKWGEKKEEKKKEKEKEKIMIAASQKAEKKRMSDESV